MENQRLWGRSSQQRSAFPLSKAAASLVGKGCQAVDKDSRVVYESGRPAVALEDGQVRVQKAWPE